MLLVEIVKACFCIVKIYVYMCKITFRFRLGRGRATRLNSASPSCFSPTHFHEELSSQKATASNSHQIYGIKDTICFLMPFIQTNDLFISKKNLQIITYGQGSLETALSSLFFLFYQKVPTKGVLLWNPEGLCTLFWDLFAYLMFQHWRGWQRGVQLIGEHE